MLQMLEKMEVKCSALAILLYVQFVETFPFAFELQVLFQWLVLDMLAACVAPPLLLRSSLHVVLFVKKALPRRLSIH